MVEVEELKKEIWTLDNEALSVSRRLAKLIEEFGKVEAKIRWIVQKKYDVNYRVYRFTKEHGTTVVKVVPDTTLATIQRELSSLLFWINRLRQDIEWIDRAFSESVAEKKGEP